MGTKEVNPLSNLWVPGKIPNSFKELLLNNANWLKEEPT